MDEINNNNIEEVISLRHFKSEIEAELLVDRLLTQGISSFIKKDDPTTMGLIRGASVMIWKADKEKAFELLRDLNY